MNIYFCGVGIHFLLSSYQNTPITNDIYSRSYVCVPNVIIPTSILNKIRAHNIRSNAFKSHSAKWLTSRLYEGIRSCLNPHILKRAGWCVHRLTRGIKVRHFNSYLTPIPWSNRCSRRGAVSLMDQALYLHTDLIYKNDWRKKPN